MQLLIQRERTGSTWCSVTLLVTSEVEAQTDVAAVALLASFVLIRCLLLASIALATFETAAPGVDESASDTLGTGSRPFCTGVRRL